MRIAINHVLGLVALALALLAGPMLGNAQAPSPRIALVIGNGAYPAGALASAPNDA